MEMLFNGIDIQSIVGNVWYLILILIFFDIITGLLASAKMHEWNSSINYVGFIKKIGELIALAFVSFLDIYFQTYGVLTKLFVGMLVIYEGMSIVENFGKIGIDLKFLEKYFDPDKIGKGNK